MNTMNKAFALLMALLLMLLSFSLADEQVDEEYFAPATDDVEVNESFDESTSDEQEVIYVDTESEAVEELEVMFGDTNEEEIDEDNTINLGDKIEEDIISSGFNQRIAVNDISISVASEVNTFPQGSWLCAEAVFDEGIENKTSMVFEMSDICTHNIYRIEIIDPAGNAILPDYDAPLPLVRIDGLSNNDAVRVAAYDSYMKEAFAVDSMDSNGIIEFPFVDSTIYDIITVQASSTQIDDGTDPENSIEDAPRIEDAQSSKKESSEGEKDQGEYKQEEEQLDENDEISQLVDEDVSESFSVEGIDKAQSEETDTDDSVELIELYENESEKLTEQDSTLMAAQAATYTPQSLTATISRNSKTTINNGDTLDIHTTKTVSSWRSSKKSVASVTFDGEKAIVTTHKPGKTTLTAILSNKKKIKLILTVKDPYLPKAVSFANLSTLYIVGDKIDLNEYIALEPSYATSKLTWKSSNKKVAKISKNGTFTALKAGTSKITVTTRNKKKRSIKVTVVANKISGLYRKPAKGEAVALGNAFSVWPKSVSYQANGRVIAEFYLLNGSKHTLNKINGLNVSILAGNRSNRLATHYFSKVRVKAKKKAVSTFKVTFPAAAVLQKDVHLADYNSSSIFFDLDTSSISASAGKKKVPFVATIIPNVPDYLGIALSTDTLTMKVGNTAQLTASLQLGTEENPSISWSSNNDAVASVDGYGLVTAQSAGNALITASVTSQDGTTYLAKCNVTVNPPTYRALLIGEGTFKGKVKDSDGYVIEDKNREGYIAEVEYFKSSLTSRKTASGTSWDIQTRFDRSANQIHQDIKDVLGKADESDVSLFFIATHGDVSREYGDAKASRLACYNTESYIKTKELAEWLSEVNGKVIVFIESCGSGGFIAESPTATNGATNEASEVYAFDPELFNNELTQAFMNLDMGVNDIAGNNAPLYAGDLRGHSTSSGDNKFYVLTSSNFQEKSFVQSSTKISFFVQYIVQGVGKSGEMKADTEYGGNMDGKVTLSELYTYISNVGDNKAHKKDGMTYYQHVQVYPANSNIILFTN